MKLYFKIVTLVLIYISIMFILIPYLLSQPSDISVFGGIIIGILTVGSFFLIPKLFKSSKKSL